MAMWAAWQFFVLIFAFLTWVNLFSEYGIYGGSAMGAVAAVVFLGIAIFLGTWLPVRRWRNE